MDGQQIWQAALGELRLQMTKATFDIWLRDTRGVSYEEGLFRIGVQTAYAKDWLENRLLLTIKRTLTNLVGKTVEVEFVVLEDRKPDMEVVSERRVTFDADGQVGQEEDWYIKLRRSFADRALRLLKGTPLSVFIYLFCEVGESGWTPILDEGDIAVKTGYSVGTVRKAIKYLEENGFILIGGQYHARRFSVKGYAWIGRHPKPSLLGEEDFKAQNLPVEGESKTQTLRFDPRAALEAEGVTGPNLERCLAAASPVEIQEKITYYRMMREQDRIQKDGPGYLVTSILGHHK